MNCIPRLFSVLLGSSAAAQQFADFVRSRPDITPLDYRTAIAHGDIDGDGDNDVLWGNYSGAVMIQRNDGRGRLVLDPAVVAASAVPTALALGDVDADGDLDLVIGNGVDIWPVGGRLLAQTQLFRNDGSGGFTDVTANHVPPDQEDTTAVVLADLDGDGDLDLAVQNLAWGHLYPRISNPGRNRIYVNDGRGTFRDASNQRWPSNYVQAFDLAAGDLDGDGDVDLVQGLLRTETGDDPEFKIYRNDGQGNFALDPSAPPPPTSHTSVVKEVRLVDVDGDGDLDVIGGSDIQDYDEHTGITYRANHLLLNDGRGRFADGRQRLPALPERVVHGSRSDLVVLDHGRDGDLDLLVVGVPDFELLENDGQGRFTLRAASPFDGRFPYVSVVPEAEAVRAVAVDLDGDRDQDVVALNSAQMKLLFDDGARRYVDVAAAQLQGGAHVAAAVADFDGDQRPDVAFGVAMDFRCVRMMRNQGNGTFREEQHRIPVLPDPHDARGLRGMAVALAAADIDGDGDQDLLVRGLWQTGALVPGLRAFLNDGRGVFRDDPARVPLGRPDDGGVNEILPADVDSDGDLDLLLMITTLIGSRAALLRNDGSGHFADASAGNLPPSFGGVLGNAAVADLDRDGDLDLVVTSTVGTRLLLNSGTGAFSEASSRLPAIVGMSHSVCTLDADRDGNLDLAIGYAMTASQAVRLLRNDGTATFTDAGPLPVANGGHVLALAANDVDRDGHVDLLVGYGWLGLGFGGRLQNELLLNDGSGGFVQPAGRGLPVRDDPTTRLHFADLDEDGDDDLVVVNRDPDGGASTSSLALFNRHRHLSMPLLPQLGRNTELRIDAAPGYARAGTWCVAMLGWQPARLALPFGVLGLDPSSAVSLPALVVGNGSIGIPVPVPAQRSLLGTTVFAQALIGVGASLDGLTNTLAWRFL